MGELLANIIARGVAGNLNPQTWGDTDCSSAITPVGSLKILRFDAGFTVTQPIGCPDVGDEVLASGLLGQ